MTLTENFNKDSAPNLHSNLYKPESLYSGWISNSLVLMTSSLLFYHMTMVKSLEMSPKFAGFFAVILILISIVYSISSIIPYFQRTNDFIQANKNNEKLKEQVDREKANIILYLVLGAILCSIELGIAIVIIKGSILVELN